MNLTQILTMVLIGLVFTIIILSFVYWLMSIKNKQGEVKQGKTTKDRNSLSIETSPKSGTSTYTKLSIFDFMQFDAVEDNMIVQDGGKRYLMVIECEGINYDLMSEVEKASVEQGFIQFLNTLRHPIQLYIQTRTINIEKSIANYNERVDSIKAELNKKQNLYNKMVQEGDCDVKDLQEVKMDIVRQQNLYDYGKDIVTNIEGMSLNKNVLRKHYYIIIPYYAAEIGSEFTDEEEKKSLIFSELYTRAQSIIRTLFACSMKCRVMNSDELVQLLYVAYNRDESEVYGIDKALEAGYGELYSTSPDVLDKKMKAINQEIEEKAFQLAQEKVQEVKSKKQIILEDREKHFQQLIKELAEIIIRENKTYVGKDVAEKAIEEIKEDAKEEEVRVDVGEKTKTTKVRRASKNA